MEDKRNSIAGEQLIEATFSLALTPRLEVVAVTEDVQRLLGFSSEDFLAARVSLKELIHIHDSDIAEILFSAAAGQSSGSFNIRIRQANGKIRCIRGEYTKKQDSITGDIFLKLLLQDAKSLERTIDSADTMTNFRAIMENTDDYIYLKDRNHVFTGASQTLVSVCHPAEHWKDLLGQTDYDVFPEEYADIYYRLEKDVFAGAPVAREIQEGLTKDGERLWVDNRKYPIHNEQGEIIGLFGIARDITEQRLTEMTLQDSEERFRALSEASFGGVGIHDNGIILDCNKGLSDITGFSYQELVGMNGLGLIAPEFRDKVLHNIQTDYEVRYEVRGIRKDGSVYPLSIKGKNVTFKGRVARVAEFSDITEQKQAEKALAESEDRFRSVMENISTVAVQGYLVDGTTIFWNRASEMLYGYSSEEALGANLLDLIIPDEMKQNVLSAIRQMDESGEPIPAAELLLKRKDGSLVPVFSSHTLLRRFGGRHELFCLDIDLSERKRIEEELLQAKKAAEAANKAKSEFLANMSHEIRTPMNGIMGMCQLLEFTELTAEQKEYASAITTSSNNLLSLINDILDLSKIEAEKLEITLANFSIRNCITELVSTQKSRITEKGLYCNIQISPEIPDALTGDQLRIKQIILNLLGNAIKFTEQGGIELTVSLVERRDPSVMLDIAVRDTGIGIPAAAQKRIFEAFSQAEHSTTMRFGGTGLGLTICRHLAELMGGSIRMESKEGEGSTFYLRLTLQLPEMLGGNPVESESFIKKDDGYGHNILLVEDNRINLLHSRALLKMMGHKVTVAENGKEALGEIKAGNFDIVLMDIKMPLMNGDEALSVLRKEESERGGHLPVIALTAFALKGDRESFLEAGFDGYLAKPITAKELSDELVRVIGS